MQAQRSVCPHPLHQSETAALQVAKAYPDVCNDAQGSATLSMAYAGALFADACLRGLNGESDVEEYTFVESNIVPELTFFSSKVKLGPNGASSSNSFAALYCMKFFEQRFSLSVCP